MARRGGVTLVELLMVLAIMALATMLAVPRSDAVDQPIADATAGEIAQACRFAQAEALRTGAWHAVGIDATAQVVRVYRLDALGKEDTANPVLHPVDKGPYRVAFGSGALRATVAAASFQYSSGVVAPYLSFAPDGTPGYMDKNGKIDPLKSNGQVTLRHGRATRLMTIDAATGRVTS